jgi:hypothetical protein
MPVLAEFEEPVFRILFFGFSAIFVKSFGDQKRSKFGNFTKRYTTDS